MTQKDYLKDISEIKNLMNASSRFISLSGLSGILAGIYALIGAFLAHNTLYTENGGHYLMRYHEVNFNDPITQKLFLIALSVLIIALITAYVLTAKKAKRHKVKVWDGTTRKLLFHFCVPLISGGAFVLIMLQYGLIGLVAPLTLIFYGLACFCASKFTLGDVKYLGITNIILGLIATQFIGYGLYFWAIGFGLMHIVYGSLMYFKYDRKQ